MDPPDRRQDGSFERFLSAAIAAILTIIFSWRLLDEKQKNQSRTCARTPRLGEIRASSVSIDSDSDPNDVSRNTHREYSVGKASLNKNGHDLNRDNICVDRKCRSDPVDITDISDICNGVSCNLAYKPSRYIAENREKSSHPSFKIGETRLKMVNVPDPLCAVTGAKYTQANGDGIRALVDTPQVTYLLKHEIPLASQLNTAMICDERISSHEDPNFQCPIESRALSSDVKTIDRAITITQPDQTSRIVHQDTDQRMSSEDIHITVDGVHSSNRDRPSNCDRCCEVTNYSNNCITKHTSAMSVIKLDAVQNDSEINHIEECNRELIGHNYDYADSLDKQTKAGFSFTSSETKNVTNYGRPLSYDSRTGDDRMANSITPVNNLVGNIVPQVVAEKLPTHADGHFVAGDNEAVDSYQDILDNSFSHPSDFYRRVGDNDEMKFRQDHYSVENYDQRYQDDPVGELNNAGRSTEFLSTFRDDIANFSSHRLEDVNSLESDSSDSESDSDEEHEYMYGFDDMKPEWLESDDDIYYRTVLEPIIEEESGDEVGEFGDYNRYGFGVAPTADRFGWFSGNTGHKSPLSDSSSRPHLNALDLCTTSTVNHKLSHFDQVVPAEYAISCISDEDDDDARSESTQTSADTVICTGALSDDSSTSGSPTRSRPGPVQSDFRLYGDRAPKYHRSNSDSDIKRYVDKTIYSPVSEYDNLGFSDEDEEFAALKTTQKKKKLVDDDDFYFLDRNSDDDRLYNSSDSDDIIVRHTRNIKQQSDGNVCFGSQDWKWTTSNDLFALSKKSLDEDIDKKSDVSSSSSSSYEDAKPSSATEEAPKGFSMVTIQDRRIEYSERRYVTERCDSADSAVDMEKNRSFDSSSSTDDILNELRTRYIINRDDIMNEGTAGREDKFVSSRDERSMSHEPIDNSDRLGDSFVGDFSLTVNNPVSPSAINENVLPNESMRDSAIVEDWQDHHDVAERPGGDSITRSDTTIDEELSIKPDNEDLSSNRNNKTIANHSPVVSNTSLDEVVSGENAGLIVDNVDVVQITDGGSISQCRSVDRDVSCNEKAHIDDFADELSDDLYEKGLVRLEPIGAESNSPLITETEREAKYGIHDSVLCTDKLPTVSMSKNCSWDRSDTVHYSASYKNQNNRDDEISWTHQSIDPVATDKRFTADIQELGDQNSRYKVMYSQLMRKPIYCNEHHDVNLEDTPTVTFDNDSKPITTVNNSRENGTFHYIECTPNPSRDRCSDDVQTCYPVTAISAKELSRSVHSGQFYGVGKRDINSHGELPARSVDCLDELNLPDKMSYDVFLNQLPVQGEINPGSNGESSGIRCVDIHGIDNPGQLSIVSPNVAESQNVLISDACIYKRELYDQECCTGDLTVDVGDTAGECSRKESRLNDTYASQSSLSARLIVDDERDKRRSEFGDDAVRQEYACNGTHLKCKTLPIERSTTIDHARDSGKSSCMKSRNRQRGDQPDIALCYEEDCDVNSDGMNECRRRNIARKKIRELTGTLNQLEKNCSEIHLLRQERPKSWEGGDMERIDNSQATSPPWSCGYGGSSGRCELPDYVQPRVRQKIIAQRVKFFSEETLSPSKDNFELQFANRVISPSVETCPRYTSPKSYSSLASSVDGLVDIERLKHSDKGEHKKRPKLDEIHPNCILSRHNKKLAHSSRTVSVDNLTKSNSRRRHSSFIETTDVDNANSSSSFRETDGDVSFPLQTPPDRTVSMMDLSSGRTRYWAKRNKKDGSKSRSMLSLGHSTPSLETDIDEPFPSEEAGMVRVMSIHELRVAQSLQRLNVPDWYRKSNISRCGSTSVLRRDSNASSISQWSSKTYGPASTRQVSSPNSSVYTLNSSSPVVIQARTLPSSLKRAHVPIMKNKENFSPDDSRLVQLPSAKFRNKERPSKLMPIPILPFKELRAKFETPSAAREITPAVKNPVAKPSLLMTQEAKKDTGILKNRQSLPSPVQQEVKFTENIQCSTSPRLEQGRREVTFNHDENLRNDTESDVSTHRGLLAAVDEEDAMTKPNSDNHTQSTSVKSLQNGSAKESLAGSRDVKSDNERLKATPTNGSTKENISLDLKSDRQRLKPTPPTNSATVAIGNSLRGNIRSVARIFEKRTSQDSQDDYRKDIPAVVITSPVARSAPVPKPSSKLAGLIRRFRETTV